MFLVPMHIPIFFSLFSKRYDKEKDMFTERSAGKLGSNIGKVRVSGKRYL